MAAYEQNENARTVEATDQSQESLSSLSRQCDALLDRLCDGRTRSLHYRKHAGKLQTLEDTRGRFRVWANNLGAFQRPASQASLDHRLRDSAQMGSAVKRQLVNILSAGEHAGRITSGKERNRVRPAQTHAGGMTAATTELDELQHLLESSVDLLYRLSILIRQQRPRGKLPLPDALPRQDPALDIRHVRDKFPKVQASAWLAERLGKAIAERRDYMSYRQAHQRHQVQLHDDGNVDEPVGSLHLAPSSKATTYEVTDPKPDTPADVETSDEAEGSLRTAMTSLMTTSDSNENGDAKLRVRDLNLLVFNDVALDYGQLIECPYCRTIQRLENYAAWEKHVLSDLQPYVCTFPDCCTGLFTSRHEWFDHEMRVHRRQWYCSRCEHLTFPKESDLATHLTQKHGVEQSELSPLLAMFQRPIACFNSGDCPLCDHWKPPEHLERNAAAFRRHLGGHLQQLALSALPQRIDGLVMLEDDIDQAISRLSSDESDEISTSHTPDIKVSELDERGLPDSKVAKKPPETPRAPPSYRGPPSHKPSWFIAPTWQYRRDGALSIGNIILDPTRPDRAAIKSPINWETGAIARDISTYHHRTETHSGTSASLGIFPLFLEKANIKLPSHHSSVEYSADHLETIRLLRSPSGAELQQLMADPRLRDMLSGGAFASKTLYMVSGVMIAKGFRFTEDASRKYAGVSVDIDASALGLPAGAVGGSVGREWGRTRSNRFESDAELVFAYRLLRIGRRGLRGDDFDARAYRKGAVLY